MMIEALRATADWLKRADFGVNAGLRKVPRDAGDPLPELIAFIGDATRDQLVANAKAPVSLPALYLSIDGPMSVPGGVETSIREGSGCVIDIRLVMAKTDTIRPKRDVHYYLRAIIASLREFNRHENEDARIRNNVAITLVDTIVIGEVLEDLGDAAVMGGLAVSFTVRDLAPNILSPAYDAFIADGLLRDWNAGAPLGVNGYLQWVTSSGFHWIDISNQAPITYEPSPPCISVGEAMTGNQWSTSWTTTPTFGIEGFFMPDPYGTVVSLIRLPTMAGTGYSGGTYPALTLYGGGFSWNFGSAELVAGSVEYLSVSVQGDQNGDINQGVNFSFPLRTAPPGIPHTPGAWLTLAVTWGPGIGAEVYLNGERIANEPDLTGTFRSYQVSDISFGNVGLFGPTGWGRLLEYGRALSDPEIKSLHRFLRKTYTALPAV